MIDQNNTSTKPVKSSYDLEFYRSQVDGSYYSAKIYVAIINEIFQPKTIFDFGCGRGAWLKAFGEAGATRLVGFDGHWNNPEDMLDSSIEFNAIDLNEADASTSVGNKYDLAMSLEVLEHLQPAKSEAAVAALCQASDVVMCGAAFLHQPGTKHINTRRHSYWAQLFASHGYGAYDLFRPKVWGDENVEYWYQQNTFLYVKNASEVQNILADKGIYPIARLETMDSVHPALLAQYAQMARQFRFLRGIVNFPRKLDSKLRKLF